MNNYVINDFSVDSFIHGTIEQFFYDNQNKIFRMVFSYLNLKHGGCLYECTITIADWWSLEVYEYNRLETVRHFSLENIPELNQILDFSCNNNELVFAGIGLHNNTAIDYKFTKPKIKITGEYDPD